MMTFRSEKDSSEFDFSRHIVTVNGEQFVFATIKEAWEFIYTKHPAQASV